jgi:soluble P-type ATPase
MAKEIQVEIPGGPPLRITRLVLDFTGTLSCDGVLVPGVAERLRELGEKLEITVLTADTFGTATQQLAGLPLTLHHIQSGADKQKFMAALDCATIAAVGNGRNDVAMVRMAGLGVAVIAPEACAGELIAVAKVVCRDILAALDLLLKPLRLKATLRD